MNNPRWFLFFIVPVVALIAACSHLGSIHSDASERRAIPQLEQVYADFRVKQVTDVSYVLSVELDEVEELFSGSVQIDFTLVKNNKAPLTIDFSEGEVLQVDVNGKSVAWAYNDFYITIEETKFLSGDKNRVAIRYKRKYEKSGIGLHRYRDAETGSTYVYTTFEPYEANKFFPNFDQPNIKASYTLDVIAPSSWKVISATKETNVKDLGISQHWFFPASARISSYVFPLHAGPFHVWEDVYQDEYGIIPLRLFARQELAKYVVTEDWFAFTKQSFKFYNDYFAIPYPFGKYDQIIAPDFRWGAMENLAAVTFNEKFVKRSAKVEQERRDLAITISHEMAHMWFGNLVTMNWWNGLWLNESFATYMAYLQIESSASFERIWDNFYSSMKDWAYWQDQLVTTHSIEMPIATTDDATANFDGITYGKGASVLKQLPFFVGTDNFKNGVRAYMKAHAYGNAELGDLTGAIAKSADLDLSQWSKSWLTTAGLNTVQVKYDCKNNVLQSLAIVQSAPEDYPTLREQKINVGFFRLPKGGAAAQKTLSLPVTYSGKSTQVKLPSGLDCPDFIYPNLDDWAYVKVLLDEKSREVLMSKIHLFEDESLRLMLWQSMWDSVSDVHMPLTDYIQFVIGNLPREQGVRIVAQVGRQIGFAHRFLWGIDKSGHDMQTQRNFLSTFVWDQVDQATPGSDRQKTMFDLWVSLASSEQELNIIYDLLQTKKVLPKLPIDQDRRWDLLLKINEFAFKDYEMMTAAESAKDKTDHGVSKSIAAQVIRPNGGVKKYWLDEISNEKTQYKLAELSSAMMHLFPSSQGQLRKQFLPSIHEKLIALKTHKVGDVATSFSRFVPMESCDEQSAKSITLMLGAHQDFVPVIFKSLQVRRQENNTCMDIARLVNIEKRN